MTRRARPINKDCGPSLMKPVKHLALAALTVAALLLPVAATRPQSASADGPPSDNQLSCYKLGVNVSATTSRHKYSYGVSCDRDDRFAFTIHIEAVYDVAT